MYFRVRFLFCTDLTDTTDIFVRTRIFTECHGISAHLHPCFSVVFRVVCFCSVRIPLIFRISCSIASVQSVRSVQFIHPPPRCSVYFRVRFLFCTDPTDTTNIFVRTRIFTECHGISAHLHPCFSVLFRVVCFCSVRIPLIFRISLPICIRVIRVIRTVPSPTSV